MTATCSDYTIGQTSLTWAPVDLRKTPRLTFLPDTIDAARSEVVRAVEATYKRSARKPRPGKQQTLEARGEKALSQEDETLGEDALKSCKYLIRVFYRSMGGEVLAFDTLAGSAAARDAIERGLLTSDVVAWRVYSDLGTTRERCVTRGKELRNSVLAAARVVTLPSQSTEAVQVIDPEGDAECLARAARQLWAIASSASRSVPAIPAVLPAIPAPPAHAFARAA